MRWGVRDEMTDEHMTTALCMNEIRGCQKYSMGPNVIYFGAQKYVTSRFVNLSDRFISDTVIGQYLQRLIRLNCSCSVMPSCPWATIHLLDKWYRKVSVSICM